MPLSTIVAPLSPTHLNIPINKPLFIAFIASADPITKEPWCPDVRKILPILQATFSPSDAPTLGFIEVGQKTEYVIPTEFRCGE
jgi:hypothetical protein